MSLQKIRKLARFGNPILREKACLLSAQEMKSETIQQLIADIRYTNQLKQYGVGIAAPQVGESVALAMIDIRPTKLRPSVEPLHAIIINPVYEGIGRRQSMWEGCLSSGVGDETLFGKALRYRRIRAQWFDENGARHDEELEGLVAQVFQHETDHLNGILFVDRVRDNKTLIVADEYRRRIA